MYKYQKPNINIPIEEAREEIERDFKKMAKKYNLPTEMQLSSVIKATKKGTVPVKDYPFIRIHNKFIEHISLEKNITNDELTRAIGILVSVWNYFPHNDLGMSPIEKMKEEGSLKTMKKGSNSQAGDNPKYEKDFGDIDKIILKLSSIAKIKLIKYSKPLGCNNKNIEKILSILEDPNINPDRAFMYLFKKARLTARAKNIKITIEDTQPAVRALGMCENYILSQMPNGHYNSRMFQDILEQNMKTVDKKENDTNSDIAYVGLNDPIESLESLLDTHNSIMNFRRKLKLPECIEESAHHILGWLALIDISEVTSYEPEDMALIVLSIAGLVSNTVEPDFVHGCDTAEFYKNFDGLFDNKKEYEKEILRFANIVLCECKDPLLMLPNLLNTPNGWEEKLLKLAPCLKQNAHITHFDKLIPSPFI